MSRSSLTSAVAIGIALLAGLAIYPFIQSLWPIQALKERTEVVSLRPIPLDSFLEVHWKGAPVVIFRPSVETMNELVAVNGLTDGPMLRVEEMPPAFVYHRLSTFRGCNLSVSPKGVLGPTWPGGWMDPCHIGAWDFAGRRVHGANGNIDLPHLVVPAHRFIKGNTEVELL